MQKTPLSRILREELTRALVFGFGFFTVITLGFVGVAHAATGGLFGDMLNKILFSEDWTTDTTGKVKDSERLGGLPSGAYQKVGSIKTCPANQCVTGFKPNGDVDCIVP